MNIKGIDLFKKLKIDNIDKNLDMNFSFTLVDHSIKIMVLFFTLVIIKVVVRKKFLKM